jgi:hypothetical protein
LVPFAPLPQGAPASSSRLKTEPSTTEFGEKALALRMALIERLLIE